MKQIWQWFKKEATMIVSDLDKVVIESDKIAISITEEALKAENSGVLQGIAVGIDSIYGGSEAENLIKVANAITPKILAVELGIQGLAEKPTGDQILAFEQEVTKAITGFTDADKSEAYSAVAANIYNQIEVLVNQKTPITFAESVNIVEKAYQDYLTVKNAQ
jgi:hypothetical protein